MYKSLDELLEIVLSNDIEKNSFHIRNNFEKYHKEFPFLYNTIGVGSAIEKILTELKDENLIYHAIEMIGSSDKHKYTKRNYILILSDLYLEKNNLNGLKKIANEYLVDEFKYLGYRKILQYYSKNYNEKFFLETFTKIEKRNSLTPRDIEAINTFIEKYAMNCKDIQMVKELIRKKKIYTKIEQFIVPMIIGYFGSREDFQEIEKIVCSEFDDEYDKYLYTEIIYNELYERSNNQYYKLNLLSVLEDLCQRIPHELKVKGYPSKLYTLLLWRVGCKYLDFDKKDKIEQIIKLLSGNNKNNLIKLYNDKYKNE